jgi:CubicO group peptidase (beta-lactamase class C family)
MRRLGITLLAIAGALVIVWPAHGQSPDLDRKIALFARYVDPLRTQLDIPGLSAAVVSAGRIVWESGFGYADVERRIAATPDTPYRIASITKTFASTLLLQCVDRGTLNLDQPMRNFGATVPDAAATVRHVLAMASDAPTGSRYRYDGDRFSALTPVVEACTRSSFRHALRVEILDRLAMFDSVPGQDLEAPSAQLAAGFDEATLARYRSVIARLAKPYTASDGRVTLADYPPRGINAAAGLISTVRDLASYSVAIDNAVLLSQSAHALAWTPFALAGSSPSPYGLGWFTQVTAAGQTVWHYGQWPTFSSLLLKVPSRNVALILLANSDGLSARFPLAGGDVLVSPFARAFIAAVK